MILNIVNYPLDSERETVSEQFQGSWRLGTVQALHAQYKSVSSVPVRTCTAFLNSRLEFRKIPKVPGIFCRKVHLPSASLLRSSSVFWKSEKDPPFLGWKDGIRSNGLL